MKFMTKKGLVCAACGKTYTPPRMQLGLSTACPRCGGDLSAPPTIGAVFRGCVTVLVVLIGVTLAFGAFVYLMEAWFGWRLTLSRRLEP